MDTLFQPYRLNGTLTLANRFMMAPLTRCMAGPGLVPTAQMAAYYGRRADIGLIISEATIIRPDGQGYPNTPASTALSRLQAGNRSPRPCMPRGARSSPSCGTWVASPTPLRPCRGAGTVCGRP